MYLVDGYNLIFSLTDSKKKLQTLREEAILFLQKQFKLRKITGQLVFDGAKEKEFSYPSPLIVVFAPKGQSADAYIVEQLEGAKHPKQMTVVTNDKGLARHAKSNGAKVLENEEFLHWLMKKRVKTTVREPVESKHQFDRLLQIFEERFRSDE